MLRRSAAGGGDGASQQRQVYPLAGRDDLAGRADPGLTVGNTGEVVLEQVFGQRKDFLQRGVAVLSGEPVEVRVGDADSAQVAADALCVLCCGPRAARRIASGLQN